MHANNSSSDVEDIDLSNSPSLSHDVQQEADKIINNYENEINEN